ncbi:MAG TPA: metalloregulator ArsR/SmtB family transcription factor [Pyrinomonadaceae bacterium]|jgi:DNA-binding transcriptional ArsR family regulator|nr:metalloregulator ArsR/SmtB family transcription factor [Pyrinomonadaceae bacterium]
MRTDHLSSTFAALADPTRRAILAKLASGEASVGEIAKPFKMSLPAVSKHLKVLSKAGLVKRSRTAQWRPVALQAAPLKEALDWIDRYRDFWEQSFDRLDEYLKELQAQEAGGKKELKENGKAKARGKKK